MLSMLRVAWTLLLAVMTEAFDSLMEELGTMLGVRELFARPEDGNAPLAGPTTA